MDPVLTTLPFRVSLPHFPYLLLQVKTHINLESLPQGFVLGAPK